MLVLTDTVVSWGRDARDGSRSRSRCARLVPSSSSNLRLAESESFHRRA